MSIVLCLLITYTGCLLPYNMTIKSTLLKLTMSITEINLLQHIIPYDYTYRTEIVLVACRNIQCLMLVDQDFPSIVRTHSSALRLEMQKYVTSLYTIKIKTNLCVTFASSGNMC